MNEQNENNAPTADDIILMADGTSCGLLFLAGNKYSSKLSDLLTFSLDESKN